MKDRVPVNPGRVLITPENGSAAYYATMTRADNPTQEGTPLNKASLLKDATAALFGLGTNAVPDDALNAIKTLINGANANADTKAKVAIGSYTGTGTWGASNPNVVTCSFAPVAAIMLGYWSNIAYYSPLNGADLTDCLFALPVQSMPTEYTLGFGFGDADSHIYGKRSSDSKTISWYTKNYNDYSDSKSADKQMNSSNCTYYILFIG